VCEGIKKWEIGVCISLIEPLLTNWPTTVAKNPGKMAVQNESDRSSWFLAIIMCGIGHNVLMRSHGLTLECLEPAVA
jgi:hypothetical protein